jgi:hypothetical protein
MRIVVGITLIGLCATLAYAETAELPKRKPGHWEITTVSEGIGTTTVDACIGKDDNIAVPAESGECSEPKVTPAGSEVIVDVVCKKPFGKQTMSTAFGGDFNSRYHATMRMTFDPPEGYPTMGVTIDGKYIGPNCPASTTPGPG